jgi:hypothetical protein
MLNLQLTEAQISKIGCPQIINIADQLPVNKNYTWPELTGIRDINALTRVVLHHDAYPKKQTTKFNNLQMAIEIANGHIKKTKDEPKGEPGIAYHGMVRNGQGYQVNDILNKTYGVASNNANTIHIMVCGDYVNFDTLTDPDRLALYGLIIAVIGVLPNYKDIKAHRELTATSCPGYDPNKVREDITKLQLLLTQSESFAVRAAKCGRINTQINYMDGLIKAGEADGNAIWALHWKEAVYKIMESQKLL